jgi:hypothetical protein
MLMALGMGMPMIPACILHRQLRQPVFPVILDRLADGVPFHQKNADASRVEHLDSAFSHAAGQNGVNLMIRDDGQRLARSMGMMLIGIANRLQFPGFGIVQRKKSCAAEMGMNRFFPALVAVCRDAEFHD